MNEYIARKIARWSIGEEYSPESDECQIIEYGILLTIESVYKTLILISLGVLFDMIVETIVFLCVFCGLRSCAGGIHMKTSFGCTMVVMFGWLLSMVGSNLHISQKLIFCILAFVFFILFLYAPVTTKNNPILDEKIKRIKKIKSIMFVLIVVIASTFVSFGLRNVMVIAITFEALTLIMVRKEDMYEK